METMRSPRALALTFPASARNRPRSRLRISHGISSLRAGEFYTTHSKLQPDFAETCIPDDLPAERAGTVSVDRLSALANRGDFN
jgi:hypothetical protein